MKKDLTADMMKELKTLNSERNSVMWSVTFSGLPEFKEYMILEHSGFFQLDIAEGFLLKNKRHV